MNLHLQRALGMVTLSSFEAWQLRLSFHKMPAENTSRPVKQIRWQNEKTEINTSSIQTKNVQFHVARMFRWLLGLEYKEISSSTLLLSSFVVVHRCHHMWMNYTLLLYFRLGTPLVRCHQTYPLVAIVQQIRAKYWYNRVFDDRCIKLA